MAIERRIVAGTALGEPPSADFVAGPAFGEPVSADFVAGTALGEPRSADFVAGTALVRSLMGHDVVEQGAVECAQWADRAKVPDTSD